LIFPQIPSTQPCLFDERSAMLSKILNPATLCCAAAIFHYDLPVWYAGHPERLSIGVCKEIGKDDVGNVAGASVPPVVSDLVFGPGGFGEL
jgi:hypothetical protein